MNTTMPKLYNGEIERCVLGAALLDPDVMEDIAPRLQENDFFDLRHQIVWAALKHLWDEGTPPDLVLVIDLLLKTDKIGAAGGHVYVASLEQSVLSTGAALDWADVVIRDSVKRDSIESMQAAVKAFQSGDTPMEVIRPLISQLETIAGKTEHSGTGWRDPKAVVAEIIDRSDPDNRQNDAPALKSNLYAIDGLGMFRGYKQGVIGARPGHGKTTLALQWSLTVSGHSPVAFFSYEQPEETLRAILIASMAGIDTRRATENRLLREEYDLFKKSAPFLADRPLYFYDMKQARGLHVHRIVSEARALKKQHDGNLGMVVVDYLQKIPPPPEFRQRREIKRTEEVGFNSHVLQQAALMEGWGSLVLSQLSRFEKERRPDSEGFMRYSMSDLRDSGQIEQDADLIWFLEPKLSQAEDATREIRIHLAKNKLGPTGFRFATLDAVHGKFYDAERKY